MAEAILPRKVGRPRIVHQIGPGEVLCRNCKRAWRPEGEMDMNKNKGTPKAACRKCRDATKNSYLKRREKQRQEIAPDGKFQPPLGPLTCSGCNMIWMPTDWCDMHLKNKTYKKFCRECRTKAKKHDEEPLILPEPVEQTCHLCKKPWLPTERDWNKGRRAFCVICLKCRSKKSHKAAILAGHPNPSPNIDPFAVVVDELKQMAI